MDMNTPQQQEIPEALHRFFLIGPRCYLLPILYVGVNLPVRRKKGSRSCVCVRFKNIKRQHRNFHKMKLHNFLAGEKGCIGIVCYLVTLKCVSKFLKESAYCIYNLTRR